MQFLVLCNLLLAFCSAETHTVALWKEEDGVWCDKGDVRFTEVTVDGNCKLIPNKLYDAAQLVGPAPGVRLIAYAKQGNKTCAISLYNGTESACLHGEFGGDISGVKLRQISPIKPLFAFSHIFKLFAPNKPTHEDECELHHIVAHGYADGITMYEIKADTERARQYLKIEDIQDRREYLKANAHNVYPMSELRRRRHG